MASTARYVSGDCNPTAVKCDPNYPIEVGDLLFLEPSNNLARPARRWSTRAARPEPGRVPRRVPGRGLAEERPADRTRPCRLNSTINHSPANVIECATAGRFLFPCAATAWNAGELVGAGQQQRQHGAAEPVRERPSPTPRLAIGRAAPAADEIGVSLTQVIVQIESTVMGGGADRRSPAAPADAV